MDIVFLIVVLQMTLSCVHLDDLLVVSSPLSVGSTWGKIGMKIHGSMYDSVEIKLVRKKFSFVGSMMLFDGGKR